MEIRYYETLPSTSKTAAEAAREGAPHLYTVVSRRQSEGRGRLSRRFFSPDGGLYFTTVLRTSLAPREYGAITPFAALAVARAIEKTSGVYVQIKWINDLLLDGKKVCGILAESGSDKKGVPYVLLGIGVNVGDIVFPAELCDIAASIGEASLEALLHAILFELSALDAAVKDGSWLADYRARSAVLSREITVIEGESKRRAVALDVKADGALVVRFENGEEGELRGGEISLRLTQ